jgi:tRNA (Thr-GGU) A37 N-methylase
MIPEKGLGEKCLVYQSEYARQKIQIRTNVRGLNSPRTGEQLITFEVVSGYVIPLPASETIVMTPIGYVKRESTSEDERDRSLVTRIVFDNELAPTLTGVDEWSHIYVIFYLHQVSLDRSEWTTEKILAARSPRHPNSIGLTLVELLKHEGKVLWVKGLDAIDGTPVLDIKPYPDWDKGKWQIVKEFRAPAWLKEINEDP